MPEKPIPTALRLPEGSAEPALTQLRRLGSWELDRLVLAWLARRGLGAIRRWGRGTRPVTYLARIGQGEFAVPTQIRIHQRKNRLQPHHLEAFAGYLQRTGCGSGTLITTGAVAPAVLRRDPRLPAVRVLSGEAWIQELQDAGIPVRRCLRPGQVLDLLLGTD